MTLVELSVAIVIFTVATGMLLQLIASGHSLRDTAREEWLATSHCQNVLEKMRSVPFRQLAALYDADPFNDPGGPGTAPGNSFEVAGLRVTSADADGFVGEVLLPSVNLGSAVAPDWQIRENQGDEMLGMPRDLNGDAVIDVDDHSNDYSILPALVRIRWRSRYGPRELRFFVSFTELQRS